MNHSSPSAVTNISLDKSHIKFMTVRPSYLRDFRNIRGWQAYITTAGISQIVFFRVPREKYLSIERLITSILAIAKPNRIGTIL